MRHSLLFLSFGSVLASALFAKRDNSPSTVCVRWSHQSALVNDTVYIYGGHLSTEPSQESNTWNNYFWKLDLSSNFSIAEPSITGLPIPSGPPAVSNGYLWNDYNDLYLYGGEYSDNPRAYPDAFELWKYSIAGSAWSTPQTTVSSGDSIQRAAEGAGVSIPGKGKGFYFGGHLDAYTTEDWDISIAREYLNSMVEYDMSSSTWTNRTVSSIEAAGFPARADGVLVHVPWGDDGILVGLSGGTNQTFNQMNIVDVYDIKTSTWTKQATSGPTPDIRVNACAVVFSAPDQSSHNIYMYGGQNLIPAGSQTQYSDMWILTVPSFTWVKVDQTNQSIPPARVGHTCHAYRGQMLVIGGYVGQNLSCDSPGIYVFDASSLEWQTEFSGGSNDGGNIDSSDEQISGTDSYDVPEVIISLIGGGQKGSATVTVPHATPDPSSPLTGSNPDYTYSSIVAAQSGHATTTSSHGSMTPSSTSTSDDGNSSNGSTAVSKSSGPSVGAIVGGAIAGVAILLSLLLLGMYLYYRRRVKQLRQSLHEAQSQNLMALKDRPYSGSYHARSESAVSSEDLLEGVEPSFVGFILRPRRSLRVVNH